MGELPLCGPGDDEREGSPQDERFSLPDRIVRSQALLFLELAFLESGRTVVAEFVLQRRRLEHGGTWRRSKLAGRHITDWAGMSDGLGILSADIEEGRVTIVHPSGPAAIEAARVKHDDGYGRDVESENLVKLIIRHFTLTHGPRRQQFGEQLLATALVNHILTRVD